MRKPLLLIGLLALALPTQARAQQSLADVAKAEEARRATVKTPAKVYTNDDLTHVNDTGISTVPTPAVASKTTPAMPTTVAPAGTLNEVKPDAQDGTPKDEKYWHDRVTAIRDSISRGKVLIDAMQSRINALTTDFVNTSDPAQRAVVETNRKTAIAELARLNEDVEKQNKALIDVQEEARKASVPAGWLR